MDTVFKGEHLLPGQLGQFFIILSFGSALFSGISYYFATTDKLNTNWQRLGRIGFYLNTTSVVGIGVCLFYIIYNHLFEYHYAWEHSSKSLPVYYIISSYWEGQEGSFWLWTFWQAVLGNILVWKARSWERPVMAVVMLSQTLLSSMLLGVEIFGERVGSSPFILLRDALDLKASTPIFNTRPELYSNYLSYITDGNGLNPLLQNYWMVIHPPTLFLGFASMIVPFAYAIAGLWQRRYKEWIAPAITYSLFGVMILGTGIIMGSFWAYESLNFGGFWAWDPVENASLLPWLTLIGAVHVLIVFKNTGHSYFMATFLTLVSFVLVLYASFLTRSGVLGETSVHAFTDLGMYWHLVVDVLIFLGITIYLLVSRWEELPITKKDEETYSREFWMFVGAVFMALSCLQLVVVTSIPVWNEMFGTKWAPPTEPVKLYNIIQGAFAVVITLLTGFTQFLKYKKTDVTRFFITTLVYLAFAGLITGLVVYVTGVYRMHLVYILIMLGSIYSILANAKILTEALKGKWKLAGSAVAHIGFGLVLVGALIAAGTSRVISENTTEQYSEDFIKAKNDPRENVMMYKNEPVKMGKYTATYVGDSVAAPNHYFKVDYKLIDDKGNVKEHFVLKPNAQANRKMGLVSSPDTKHYLFSDIYTHVNMSNNITYEESEGTDGHENGDDDKDFEPAIKHEVGVGDTIRYRDGFIVLKKINTSARVENIALQNGDISLGAELEVNANGKKYTAEPIYLLRGNNPFDFPRKVEDAGLKLRFTNVLASQKKVEISVAQQPEDQKKYIVMRAIQFPYINFFWAGTVIMVIGFVMSIVRRNKELRPEPAVATTTGGGPKGNPRKPKA